MTGERTGWNFGFFDRVDSIRTSKMVIAIDKLHGRCTRTCSVFTYGINNNNNARVIGNGGRGEGSQEKLRKCHSALEMGSVERHHANQTRNKTGAWQCKNLTDVSESNLTGLPD